MWQRIKDKIQINNFKNVQINVAKDNSHIEVQQSNGGKEENNNP